MRRRYWTGALLTAFLVARGAVLPVPAALFALRDFLASAQRLSWPSRIRSLASSLSVRFPVAGFSIGATIDTFRGLPRFGF